MPKEDILTKTTHLEERLSAVKQLPGTLRTHFVKPLGNYSIAYGFSSIFSCPDTPLKSFEILPKPAEEGSEPEIEQEEPEQEELVDEEPAQPATPLQPTDVQLNPGDFVYPICFLSH